MSHSEIAGSRDICSYPALIAAYHVLHRLREPRHPPCALSYFCNDAPLAYPQERDGRAPPILSAVVLIYSLACANMSKIDKKWRITDSNR